MAGVELRAVLGWGLPSREGRWWSRRWAWRLQLTRCLHTGCTTHSLTSGWTCPTAPMDSTLGPPCKHLPYALHRCRGQGRQRGWGTVLEKNKPNQARHSMYDAILDWTLGWAKWPQREIKDKLTQDCKLQVTYKNCIIASFPIKNIFIFRKYSKIFRGGDVVFAAYLK